MVSVVQKVALAYLARKGAQQGLYQQSFLQMKGPASDAIVVRIAGIFPPIDLKIQKARKSRSKHSVKFN